MKNDSDYLQFDGAPLEKFLYEDKRAKLPEELIGKAEEKFSFGEKNDAKILFLYDLKIGTKLYSPKALEGLYNVLYEEKPDIIVISGILPRVPSYFGRKLKEFLRNVDNNIPEKYGKEAWNEILNKRRKEADIGIEDYDESPIPRDLWEFVLIAKYELKKLFTNLNYTPKKIIYLWSQDDWENTLDLADVYFRKESAKKMENLKKRRSELKKRKKEIERKLKKLENDLDIKSDEYEELLKELESVEDEEAEISSKIHYQKYRSMLKQWNIVAKDFQEAIDKVKTKYISEFINPIFSGYENKKIYPYNTIEIEYEGFGPLLISYNLNRIISKTSITSNIYRYQQLARNLKSRTGRSPKMIIDGSMHKGGFRVLADNVDGPDNVDVLYIVKLLAFAKWDKDLALKKAYAVDEQKRGMYDIDERGVVLLDIYKYGNIRFRVISTETLEYYQRYGYGKFSKYKIIAAGDFHIGSSNIVSAPSNYEYVEMIGNEILKKKPDMVVLTGDLIDGMHREEYKYIDSNLVPIKQQKIINEIERKIGRLEKKLPNVHNAETRKKLKQEISELKILEKRILFYTRKISHLSLQKEELLNRFLKPYMLKYLKKSKNGKLVIISGQHYNKVTFMFDEATDIKQLFEMSSESVSRRVHSIGGSELGVGNVILDGINFFFIHGPRVGKWSYKDPAYKLLEQTNKGFPDSRIAICGDLHIPAIGVANGKAAIVAPAAQQITKYAEEKGYTAPVRGFIELNVKQRKSDKKVINDYEFELYLDDYFREKYPEHFFKISKYLKQPILL